MFRCSAGLHRGYFIEDCRENKEERGELKAEGGHMLGHSGLFDLTESTTGRSDWASRKSGSMQAILHLDRMVT